MFHFHQRKLSASKFGLDFTELLWLHTFLQLTALQATGAKMQKFDKLKKPHKNHQIRIKKQYEYDLVKGKKLHF